MPNPVGRPRTTSLPPEEMIKLGEEMVEWVKSNDPLHLSQWYSIEKNFLESEWDAMSRMPEFLPYYEKALKLVGLKYLDKNSNVRDGISQRWQRVYFKDLKRQEDEDKRFEADLKKTEQTQEQKVVFEVNYKNDSCDQVQISPKKLSDSCTPSSE